VKKIVQIPSKKQKVKSKKLRIKFFLIDPKIIKQGNKTRTYLGSEENVPVRVGNK